MTDETRKRLASSELTSLIRSRDALDAQITGLVRGAALAVGRAREWPDSMIASLVRVHLSSDGQEIVLNWELDSDWGVQVEQEHITFAQLADPHATFLQFRRIYRYACPDCGRREADHECRACRRRCEEFWFEASDTPADVRAIVRYLLDSGQSAAFVRDISALADDQLAALDLDMFEPLLLAENRAVRERAQLALGRLRQNESRPSARR